MFPFLMGTQHPEIRTLEESEKKRTAFQLNFPVLSPSSLWDFLDFFLAGSTQLIFCLLVFGLGHVFDEPSRPPSQGGVCCLFQLVQISSH